MNRCSLQINERVQQPENTPDARSLVEDFLSFVSFFFFTCQPSCLIGCLYSTEEQLKAVAVHISECKFYMSEDVYTAAYRNAVR